MTLSLCHGDSNWLSKQQISVVFPVYLLHIAAVVPHSEEPGLS
jgi:hypothetical protein